MESFLLFAAACVLPVLPLESAEVPKTNAYVAALDELRDFGPLPFREAVRVTTGRAVLTLNTNEVQHRELIDRLRVAADGALKAARESGIAAGRPNEAGNNLEPIVRDALHRAGLSGVVPTNAAGTQQVAGYPDMEIGGPVPCYFELKTYSARTHESSQRTFYYSASARPKITKDALHLLLAFELERQQRGNNNVFTPVRWTLVTLEDLEVELKLEFNQSNRKLYAEEAVIASGAVENP